MPKRKINDDTETMVSNRPKRQSALDSVLIFKNQLTGKGLTGKGDKRLTIVKVPNSDQTHAAYVYKGDGRKILFNMNDSVYWSPTNLPPDGFHLPKWKNYERPLLRRCFDPARIGICGLHARAYANAVERLGVDQAIEKLVATNEQDLLTLFA